MRGLAGLLMLAVLLMLALAVLLVLLALAELSVSFSSIAVRDFWLLSVYDRDWLVSRPYTADVLRRLWSDGARSHGLWRGGDWFKLLQCPRGHR